MNDILRKALLDFVNSGGAVLRGVMPDRVSGVSTDSRKINEGDIFVALIGDKFDGHNYVAEAASKGAAVAIVQTEMQSFAIERLREAGKNIPLILTNDSLSALGELAAHYRSLFTVRIAAVTGSAGKTSTKEAIASILSRLGKTLATEGNFNNLVGLPLTIFRLLPEHQYAVLEMGMNRRGEISRLAQIANPDFGLITNVLPVHLEGLGSVENVAKAKEELFETMRSKTTAVVNLDDERVRTMKSHAALSRVTYGSDKNSQVRLLSYSYCEDGKLRVSISLEGETIECFLRLLGGHNAKNAVAAAAVAYAVGADAKSIKEGLEAITPYKHRFELKHTSGMKILDDSYNSNPEAVKEALGVLTSMAPEEKRVAVLGEMKELGERTAELHKEIGLHAVRSGLKALYCFGSAEALAMREGAIEAGVNIEIGCGEEIEEALKFVRQNASEGAVVLIKGSRAMALERLVERLVE